MKNLIRAALLCLAVVACTPEPIPEEPPLFSAYDPTVQCPADQVGWDLSTGGGLEPLQRNSVGDAIKLINANLTNCGVTGADLRAACDGEAECMRQVTCDDAAVDVTYVCGTEPATYKARVEGTGAERILRVSCGLPLVVLRASYAPNGPTPANITTALAARCTGKRRCSNGVSAYELNAYQDPLPNQAKTVRVTYRCGIEPAERIVEVDDFKLDFYCPIAANKFPVREPIRIVSAEPRMHAPVAHWEANNLAYAAELKAQLAKACDGKPECDVTFTGKRLDGSEPGDWRPDRDINRAWTLKGFDTMGWRDLYNAGRSGDVLLGGNLLVVGYVCGQGTWVNYRAVDPMAPLPNNRVNLRCGDFVTVTGVDSKEYGERTLRANPWLTSTMIARCNGQRVCTPPAYFGRSGPGRYLAPDGGFINLPETLLVRYTCGDLTNSVSAETTINAYANTNLGQIECPTAAGDLLATGVRLVSVTPAERTLEVSRLCGGRDQCTAPGGVTATYRCANDPQLKTSNPGMQCLTQVFPVSITSSGYACWRQPQSTACSTQPGTCNYWPQYASDYQRDRCGNVTFSYTCGCDPTVRTITYPPQANGLAAQHAAPAVLTCPSVATACARKACVPKVCTGATRRNGDLACVADTSLKPTHFAAKPAVNNWVGLPDGGTDPIGQVVALPADRTYVYKSDFPYQVFSSVLYKTDDGQPLNEKATAVVWSHDQFEKVAGATSPDGGVLPQSVHGMRCVLGEASLRGAERTSTVPGYRWALTGGKGQTIPSTCYDQDGYNDPSTSVFDAAAALGLQESQFRTRYTYSKTWVTTSFDPHGIAAVRRRTPTAAAVGVNPIGFFYDPRRDYVSTSGYYSQTADFSNSVQVRFVPSTELELGVLFENVSYGDLTLDVERPEQLPSFDVDMSWYLRGDSAANPYSPRTRVANNPANTSLADRNLRLTVEMARSDTGLANPWQETNTVRFPSVPLRGGNNFMQTDHARLDITPAIRKRLMTVRTDPNSLATASAPDGFMSDMLDFDTAFLVRSCIDLDGMPRETQDTAIDDRTLPSLNGYTLKVTRRCSPTRTIVFQRQLFVRPQTPSANDELKNDKGGVQPTGDRDVGGANANGAEVGCVRQCTVNADCGIDGVCNPGANGTLGTCQKTPKNRQCKDNSRTQGGMAGQFPISLYDARSEGSTEATQMRAGEAQTKNCASSRGSLVTFSVMEPTPRCEDRLDSPEPWELTLEFSPMIEPIIAFFKGKRYGVFNTDAKKTLMRRRNLSVRRSKGNPLSPLSSGIGLSAGREFYINIGPVPIVIEVGASAGFSFKLELEFKRETAKVGMTSTFYPCINNTDTTCYSVETTPKTFDDALESCRVKGGTLANAQTTAMLNSLNTALDNADGGTTTAGPAFWIGAQAAYAYTYPPCGTTGRFVDGGTGPNGSFSPACQTGSATSYEWLEGGSMARQTGLVPGIVAGTSRNNVFSNLAFAASPVPQKAGVTYQRSGRVNWALTSTQLPSVCSFESATEVKAASFAKKFVIEFSVGLNAAICVPSTRLGVCVSLDFQIFTANWAFGSSQFEANVFRGPENGRYQKSLFGESENFGTWERSLLSGSLNFELRAFFFTKSFKIKEFSISDKLKWEGDIYPRTSSPYFRRF